VSEYIPRNETYRLTTGRGRLELRADGARACGLYLDNKPILYHWDASESTAIDAYFHFMALELGNELSDLRRIVAQEPTPERSLSDLIQPLLSLFANGEYTLSFGRVPDDYATGFWEEQWGEMYASMDTLHLIATQPEKGLDLVRVFDYIERIERGERPWAITLVAAWNAEFILDGHHKLTAYQECRVLPWRLKITPQFHNLLSFDDWPAAETPFLPQSWFNYFANK